MSGAYPLAESARMGFRTAKDAFVLSVTNAAWDLPRSQEFYKTDYDLFAEFDEEYWYGEAS